VHARHAKLSGGHGTITSLSVALIRGSATRGRLVGPGFSVPCAIGRTGVTRTKREGDGASPAGRFAVLRGWYRPDRFAVRPQSGVPLAAMRRTDGWCDAVGDANYNRPVRLPYPRSHEAMWRDDGLYDLVLALDWNITRRAQGRGSAIFFHLARPDTAPTAGCVAIAKADMVKLLARLGRGATIRIG
jgi:L,D-peptidoglycan transpeptidase YkuD (ErfK/YbiS/YcfS/YnhG family)